MKKILHISKYYYPYIGGIEDVCYNIVNILKKQNDVTQNIFCFNDKNKTVNEQYGGVEVTRVAIKGVLSSQPVSICYKKELKKLIQSFNPTHIHFHAPNPLGAYFLLKVIPKNTKLIVHWHSDIVAQKFIYQFIRPIEKQLLKRANIIICTSPNYAQFSEPLKLFSNKIKIIQNAIDGNKFLLNSKIENKIQKIKTQYDNKPIVLFVGRHVEYKGLRYLIEATKYIKYDCEIVIGGRGILTEELKTASQQLKNISFIGRIADEDLPAYYYASTIFAFPSITKNEAFGVALAEAMYCETPTVTFTIEGSGVNWVSINQETGIEVENSNSILLAEAIDTLLSNERLRKEMSTKARQRAEEMFLIHQIEEKIKLLYQ